MSTDSPLTSTDSLPTSSDSLLTALDLEVSEQLNTVGNIQSFMLDGWTAGLAGLQTTATNRALLLRAVLTKKMIKYVGLTLSDKDIEKA